MRYPTAVKYEEPIRQMSDSRHHIGRTPVDYYRTVKEYDGQTTSLYDYYRLIQPLPHLYNLESLSRWSTEITELKAFHFMIECTLRNV